MSGGLNTFTISGDFGGLQVYFNALGDEAVKAARPAAKVISDVLYGAVQDNANRIKKKTGLLAASIYRAYSKDKSPTPGVESYHVSWRTNKSSGLPRAPHGHLVERGYLQRYQVYVNNKGEFKTAIRPEMIGKPKPKRRAPQAEKDAYYVPRPGGPRQVPGLGFVRSAIAREHEALTAGERYLVGKILDAAAK